MTSTPGGLGRSTQRAIGAVILLVAGMVSLPFSAAFLDREGTESWILPVQFAVMAALGAETAVVLPALARPGATTVRRALTGVGWGLLAALVGVAVFWLLLNGFEGA
ncbi:hypothetical protein [Nocardioides daphniae]|uniref:Uncharacterized protein n=1 Tax=Nocardioides daphniae TaxID=402297 RepID=A0A4P7U7M5_9ACTN|nr:hypothetical protein [Nocardioides daphniae]QCC76203.1 hypothetical protein E2C04_01485 [Nocardioides daphniae]GGD09020.1 hypothetical protein GCM10007231_04880 [Nocardioides daphniae]